MPHRKQHTDYDAVIIGSGPNGLSAAIALQREGLRTIVIEAKATVGGGMRTAELTLPGFHHDVCSAVHPLAAGSPFFQQLPLGSFGLEYLYPEINAAHPLDGRKGAAVFTDIRYTAALLGSDAKNYTQIFSDLKADWPALRYQLLGPMQMRGDLVKLAAFGWKGLRSATSFTQCFESIQAKALFAGMAAHSIQPLTNAGTAGFGLVLLMAAHDAGWPIPKGGSASIASALTAYYTSLGGQVQTNFEVRSLSQLPSSKAVLFDTAPDQLLTIAGHKLSALYKWQLNRYSYGPGIFKIDWALDGPVPFKDEGARLAGTVHIGNTEAEIVAAEQLAVNGQHADAPFVLLAQPTITDPSRSPQGKHVAWAYCHVPNGSATDMTMQIERQVERFAPGFRERILARHTFNSVQLQSYNANYVGGDINAGASIITQMFSRPALRWSPYRTSSKGLYICSASTPPGGGVHGMCGFHAARRAAKDIFKIDIKLR